MRTEVDYAELLTNLVRTARNEKDAEKFIASIFDKTDLKPEEVHSFGEALERVLASRADNLLNETGENRCSFCLKKAGEYKKLVKSPNASICNECVAIAQRTIDESGKLGFLFRKLW